MVQEPNPCNDQTQKMGGGKDFVYTEGGIRRKMEIAKKKPGKK
jgi:hypothetical protein